MNRSTASTSPAFGPEIVKFWALHEEHDDRNFVVSGEIEVVLYDVHPDSSTYGQISKLLIGESNRRLVSIPKFVWHADHNIGSKDAVILNMPTKAYNHANSDKYRLLLDTPHIPYSFNGMKGW